jgi:dihydroflavonol-4-reductase
MVIAVSGANGHVGINLCRKLLEHGHTVRTLLHKNDFALRSLNTEMFHGDLLNHEDLAHFVDGVEIVFHLAAKISISGNQRDSLGKINVEGTRNLVHFSKKAGVRRFIHFSSIHAVRQYPKNQVLDETRALVGDNAFLYDRSKAEGERIVLQAATEGLDSFVLSPTAIIGPLDYEPSLTGKAFLQLYQHQIPALVPGGYNWVDVRDVVDTAIDSIDKAKKGEKYLLSGNWHSLKEISCLIQEITHQRTTQVEMPFWLARVGLPFITLYSKITGVDPLYTSESLTIIKQSNKMISNLKARQELGFNPRPVQDSIRDIFEWYKEIGYLQKKQIHHVSREF